MSYESLFRNNSSIASAALRARANQRDRLNLERTLFLESLPLTERNALNYIVNIRKGRAIVRVRYADFLTLWRRNGWTLAQPVPHSNVYIRSSNIEVNIPRTNREVNTELAWSAAPIGESVYAAFYRNKYIHERDLLATSHNFIVNPEWNNWALRAWRWAVYQQLDGRYKGYERNELEFLAMRDYEIAHKTIRFRGREVWSRNAPSTDPMPDLIITIDEFRRRYPYYQPL